MANNLPLYSTRHFSSVLQDSVFVFGSKALSSVSTTHPSATLFRFAAHGVWEPRGCILEQISSPVNGSFHCAATQLFCLVSFMTSCCLVLTLFSFFFCSMIIFIILKEFKIVISKHLLDQRTGSLDRYVRLLPSMTSLHPTSGTAMVKGPCICSATCTLVHT